jgi:hypothetical protein
VKFKITRHSGFAPPEDALDLLWQRLGANHEGIRFTRVGSALIATVGEDAPVSMTRDERADIGRRAILEVVLDTCERAPDLKSDWFAVSFEGS